MKLSRPVLVSCCFALLSLTQIHLFSLNVAEANEPPAAHKEETRKWTMLFDGKTMTNWTVPKFGGDGDVTIEKEQLILDPGNPITGITYTGKLPTVNFEIELEAQRAEGGDFFCALTFPVKESHCSFVLGGWGGTVVGISSIGGYDASENETTQAMAFEKGKFYKVRVRVVDGRIMAWIDDKSVVDVDVRDRKVNTRIEVDQSKPLGITAYETKSIIKDIRIRELSPEEVKANLLPPEKK
jgi:hypothetical protein